MKLNYYCVYGDEVWTGYRVIWEDVHRRYVYWRLLSTDPEAAKDVVLAEKPVIADSTSSMDPALLTELLGELSTLASVRPIPPHLPLACPAVLGAVVPTLGMGGWSTWMECARACHHQASR